MSWDVARRAVDLLLESPGRDKTLSIYGGEPTLHPALLERLIPYARLRERRLRKRCAIFCCTNGVRSKVSLLELFRSHDVRLHFSLFARPRVHERWRPQPGGRPTHDGILKNILEARKVLGTSRVGVCLCVVPSEARTFALDFFSAVDTTGVDLVSLEFIRWSGERWTPPALKALVSGLDRVLDRIVKRAARGRFVHLALLGMDWRRPYLEKFSDRSRWPSFCVFENHLEIEPKGGLSFSPFHLYRGRQEPGENIRTVTSGPLSRCRFKAGGPACRGCWDRHTAPPEADEGAQVLQDVVFKTLNAASREILSRARRDKMFRRYVREGRARAG